MSAQRAKRSPGGGPLPVTLIVVAVWAWVAAGQAAPGQGVSPAALGLSSLRAERTLRPGHPARLGRPARPTPKRKTSRANKVLAADPKGQVSSVTSDAAFVDRGSVDGVSAGQKLSFSRGGKSAGTCVVDAVSEHFARCAGTGLRAGDRFAVTRGAPTSTLGPGPLPSERDLRARSLALEDVSWVLRDFEGGDPIGQGLGTRVEALFSHTTWGNPNSTNGAFGIQRLDVAVYDVELWKGLRASVDLTALNYSARPAVTQTLYQRSPVLLVRQLELGFRRADVPFSASVGRTWLRSATNLLVLDGAQAAWRFGDGVELGAYGGLLPDAARLEVRPSQWAAGAFGRLRFSSGTGPEAVLVQLALRAGWSLRDVLGGRAEVGLTASLWKAQNFDAHLGLEFGFGASQAPAGLDAARLDVGWRPSETVRVSGAVRYRGMPTTGLQELGTLSPGQRALHADGALTWVANSWLLVAAQAGLATDFGAGLTQARVGPELSMPRLLGTPLGLSLGYLEEFGWVRGRHGYLQLSVTPSSMFRVLTRTSWFQQQTVLGAEGLAGHELGTTVALEVSPWRFLKARVQLTGRLPVGDAPASPLGSIGAQVGGAF